MQTPGLSHYQSSLTTIASWSVTPGKAQSKLFSWYPPRLRAWHPQSWSFQVQWLIRYLQVFHTLKVCHGPHSTHSLWYRHLPHASHLQGGSRHWEALRQSRRACVQWCTLPLSWDSTVLVAEGWYLRKDLVQLAVWWVLAVWNGGCMSHACKPGLSQMLLPCFSLPSRLVTQEATAQCSFISRLWNGCDNPLGLKKKMLTSSFEHKQPGQHLNSWNYGTWIFYNPTIFLHTSCGKPIITI